MGLPRIIRKAVASLSGAGRRGAADPFMLLVVATLTALVSAGYDKNRLEQIILSDCAGVTLLGSQGGGIFVKPCRDALSNAVGEALNSGAANQSDLFGMGMMLLAESDREMNEAREAPCVIAFSATPAEAMPDQPQQLEITVMDAPDRVEVGIDITGSDGFGMHRAATVGPGTGTITADLPGAPAGTVITVEVTAGTVVRTFTTKVRTEEKYYRTYKGSYTGSGQCEFEFFSCTEAFSGTATMTIGIMPDDTYDGYFDFAETYQIRCTAKSTGHGDPPNSTRTGGWSWTAAGTLPKLQWSNNASYTAGLRTMDSTISDQSINGVLTINRDFGCSAITAPLTLQRQ